MKIKVFFSYLGIGEFRDLGFFFFFCLKKERIKLEVLHFLLELV